MVNINWQLTMYLEEINEPPRGKQKDESKQHKSDKINNNNYYKQTNKNRIKRPVRSQYSPSHVKKCTILTFQSRLKFKGFSVLSTLGEFNGNFFCTINNLTLTF